MCRLRRPKTIYLISCAKKQLNVDIHIIAAALYISTLFRLMLQYALLCTKGDIERIYILSSKHGLLKLTDKVCPYNVSLEELSMEDREIWGKKIADSLENEGYSFETDRFVILASNAYVHHITGPDKIQKFKQPLRNKRLGEKLNFLKDEIEKKRP